MKARPITFTAAEVRATRDGRKTQFRRVIDPQPAEGLAWRGICSRSFGKSHKGKHVFTDRAPYCDKHQEIRCPYGQPGDRLWVRETFAYNKGTAGGCLYKCDYGDAQLLYVCSLKTGEMTHIVDRWQSPATMPRDASRILLEIESVRVERLQDITRGDAIAEGCPFPNMQKGPDPREWFAEGCAYWAENPWVWVVEFRVVEGGTND